MITGINESKALATHMLSEYKCKLDGNNCNLNQWWDNDKYWCECKKHHVSEKGCLESCYI